MLDFRKRKCKCRTNQPTKTTMPRASIGEWLQSPSERRNEERSKMSKLREIYRKWADRHLLFREWSSFICKRFQLVIPVINLAKVYPAWLGVSTAGLVWAYNIWNRWILSPQFAHVAAVSLTFRQGFVRWGWTLLKHLDVTLIETAVLTSAALRYDCSRFLQFCLEKHNH